MIKKLIDKMRPEPKVRIAVLNNDPMVLLDDFGQVIGVAINGQLAAFSRGYVEDYEQAQEIEGTYEHFLTEQGEDGLTYLVTD